MILSDVISFRKDLMFDGAVQVSWFEKDKDKAEKAAKHFIFHGPEYHGIADVDYESSAHSIVDTAYFTKDLLKRISGEIDEEPFMVAIAGYGTGKSHIGVTLATLLSNPSSIVSSSIISNLKKADKTIGSDIQNHLNVNNQPYLVVALNGMKDFDLNNEIIRQIISQLNSNGLDTSFIEDLRPRFKNAIKFTQSLFDSLSSDFQHNFGERASLDDIITNLKAHDEVTFNKISKIFESIMGHRIHAAGQESLSDLVKIFKDNYCGENKHYAGLLILFDEFGRYMEFAVQKPQIAGPGALQQLYEAVQANREDVFLLCFIQFELNSYVRRVVDPDLKNDIRRYVTRYDNARKVKLSTNLETLIANLLEKKDEEKLNQMLVETGNNTTLLQEKMKKWFPSINNHNLWLDKKSFDKVIWRGCWPLHPVSTWLLYQLTSIGKSLQQRSALSFVAEVFEDNKNIQIDSGVTLRPIHFCHEKMINEFLESERYGYQGATAHAYQSTVDKYQYELNEYEITILKAIVLITKIGIKIESQDDYIFALHVFSGLSENQVKDAVNMLENEYAVLTWNEGIKQYEIAGESVPRKKFLEELDREASKIKYEKIGELFRFNFKSWINEEFVNTDFGPKNNIYTKEWNYRTYFTDVAMLASQISYAFQNWIDAVNVDEEKGQIIYCYLGPESNLETTKAKVQEVLDKMLTKYSIEASTGAPVIVLFLNDEDGVFADNIAKYWVLKEVFSAEDYHEQYKRFIEDHESKIFDMIKNRFVEFKRDKSFSTANQNEIKEKRLTYLLESIFDNVYPNRIPFPFDGFNTARGNAAKDCRSFTKELFMGRFDKHWVASCSRQAKNRAYEVFDESWSVISEDGSIRLKPNNYKVRDIIELMEGKINQFSDEDDSGPLNLGNMARILIKPPYGCNLASAGLLIALFIGRRRDHGIVLHKSSESISIENWLQVALPKNFLELSVLDETEVTIVSEEGKSEWESLLDKWSSEKLLEKKVEFLNSAQELQSRVELPQQLYPQYKRLKEKAEEAKAQLSWLDDQIDEALSKIGNGIEKENASLISWGGADLVDILYTIHNQRDIWSNEQYDEVKKYCDNAKLKTKRIFPVWLQKQKVNDIESLGKFKHKMLRQIDSNLTKLKLEEEKEQLADHVRQVEKDVRFKKQGEELVAEAINTVNKNKVTDRTPIAHLTSWIKQANDCCEKIKKASSETNIMEKELKEVQEKLFGFNKKCKSMIKQHKDRTSQIYNIECINDANELTYWRNETAALIYISEGQEIDVEDLKQVQVQLDLIEKHYRLLDDESLSDKELDNTYEDCVVETENIFPDEVPLPEYEHIYENLLKSIKNVRAKKAKAWIENNVPDLKRVKTYSVDRALEIKNKLLNRPSLLSVEQEQIVQDVIAACDDRLEELDVEGMVARFKSLSKDKKRLFIKHIEKYIKEMVNIYM